MKRSRKNIKRNSKDDCDNDRISMLPRNIIDLIMEFLPILDAARTCVLSTKWRYIWADHPTVVVDNEFWDVIKGSKLTSNVTGIDFASIVNRILLSHSGMVHKFFVDISVIRSQQHCDINIWLSLLCRRGVKFLILDNSVSTTYYTVPSSVFSAPELADLVIYSCIFKAKEIFGSLQRLSLYSVTLDPCVLTTPLLTSLALEECYGIRDFNISAPKIESLTFVWNDYFNLKPYLTCKSINYALLYSNETTEYPEAQESVNLVHLLAAWPSMSDLMMDGICFKHLATGRMPDILELSLRCITLYDINLDREQMAWILRILKNSGLLHTFEIWFAATTMLEEVNEIDEQSIMDYRMEQLRTVRMKFFNASRIQVLFAKTLLHSAPLLGKLLVEENVKLAANERLKISKELLLLQRGFKTPDIIFGENLVSKYRI